MLSRQRRAEVVVVRSRFIDKAIDASFQDVRLSDGGWAKNLSTLTDSLYQGVFSSQELDDLVRTLTNGAEEHPLLEQINVIRSLRSLNQEEDISSLFNPDLERELTQSIESARKYVIRCEKAARDELKENKELAEKRAKNTKRKNEAELLVSEYQSKFLDGNHGDIRGDDPTLKQIKAYKEACVFLYGHDIKQAALQVARNELRQYEEQITKLEDQKIRLRSLGYIEQIRKAAEDFAQKYPTARELVTVEQFLFCLMADVLVTLNTLVESHVTSLDGQRAKREFNESNIVKNIKGQISRLAPGGYLPKALEVHELFKIQNEADLLQFIGDIGEHKRLQYTSTTTGFPRVDSQVSVADDSAYNDSMIVLEDNSSQPPSETETVVPATPYFPVYLAKSFMLHLANAMQAYVSGMKGNDENTVSKKGLMEAAEEWLRNRDPQAEPAMTSFKDIYDAIPDGSTQTIAQILNSQRHVGVGSKPSDAFAKTFTQAGEAFLKENPVSLMRRHAFLEWLQETCTFPKEVDLNIAKGHLIEVVAQIKALRAVMKLLYPTSAEPVTAKTILKCVSRLVAFGKENEEKNAEIAILVRVLLLAGVDKLDSANFAQLQPADKSWLLNSAEIITDQQGYLKAVAKNITATPQVSEYGIGPFVTALLEITSFQQARYDALFNYQPYTHQEHQEKIESTVLHLSQCVENYFEESALKPKAEMPQPAQVAKVFSTTHQSMDDTIELTVRSCASGDRLRLPVNLQSDIQAMLTWGVTGDNPVHLRTLALLNSGKNLDELLQWKDKLAYSDSPAAWINAAMLQQDLGYAENIFSRLGALNSLAKRIKYYTALVALAETLLQHLKGVQSEPEMPQNEGLAQFYKAVYENINRLMEVIVQEQNDAPSDDVQEELEALAGRVQEFSAGLIGVCYAEGANNVIEFIKSQVFDSRIINPKNPAFVSAFLEIAQSTNPVEDQDQYFIDVMFTLAHHPMQATEKQSIRKLSLEKFLCRQISSSITVTHKGAEIVASNLYPSTPEARQKTTWYSLSIERFYGNSKELQQLINYYYLRENYNQVAIKKALKIAIFGFAYPDFAANKLMFAQQILRAFAELAALSLLNDEDENDVAQRLMNECHDSIAYLKQAFALLATTPGLRFELGEFIGALKALAEEIGDDTENHFHSLDIEAKKQHVVYEIDETSTNRHDAITKGTLLGLKIGAQRYVEQAARHRRAVSSLRLPRPVGAAAPVVARSGDELFAPHRGAVRSNDQIGADFSAIITGLVDGAFPEYDRTSTAEPRIRLRYFLTKAWRSDENKLNRQTLKDMLWNEIQEQTALGKQIESSALNNAIAKLFEKVDAVRVTSDINGFQTVQFLRSATATIAERTAIKLVTTERVFFDNKTLAQIATQAAAGLNGLIAEKAQSALLIDDQVADDHNEESDELQDSSNNTGYAKVDSDEELPNSYEVLEISEEAVTNAVIAAIEWLEGTPTVDNIPAEVSLVIDTSSLLQGHINGFKRRLAGIEDDWFAYRVKLIRAGKSPRALEHVVNNVRQSLEDYGSAAELDAFIDQLKRKIEERPAAEYQRYLNDFVWVVAETMMLQKKKLDHISPNNDDYQQAQEQAQQSDALLAVIKAQRYDDVALIALGCEQYAMMSEAARSQKGSRLLEALLHIVSQSGLFTDERQNLLPEACRSLIEKLQAALKKRNDGVQPQHDDGTAIYYLIYTLAQAMSYEEDSVIKARYESRETAVLNDSGIEFEDYTGHNQTPDNDEENVEYPETLNNSVARQLLDKLNALLFSNPTFSEWHRRILKIGSRYKSSLHVLTFHEEYVVAEMLKWLAEPSHSDSAEVMNRISKMRYFWEKSYAERNFLAQFAYEALAIDELVRILNTDTIEEVAVENFHAKDGNYATQHNTILEQLALVFLAVKRWYKPKKCPTMVENVEEDAEENARTPFIPALSLLASGFVVSGEQGASFELMMQTLLEKACDSFNAMLQPTNQEKSASQTAEYVLLTKEVIQWLKDTPKILDVYVARTLETGVHCKEQAELIFQLLSQASETPTIEFIPQNSQNDRRVSNVGVELSLLFSSSTSSLSKNGYKPVLTEEDEYELPTSTRESVITSALPPKKLRSDDELQLLSNAFKCMYQYIDQGIPKKTRLKLFSSTVETRLKEFLAQVEKHNLWQDYWTYVAELEQPNSVKNHDVGNRLSEKGKPYLKLYTDLLWNCWVANSDKEQEEEGQKEVWLNVVMGHLFGNCVAIEDVPGATLIVRQIVDVALDDDIQYVVDVALDDDIQYVADNHGARGLAALAGRLVTIKLNQPLDNSSKRKRALEVIQFVRDKMLRVFLNVTPSLEDKQAFLYHVLLKPLKEFFKCEDKKFYRTYSTVRNVLLDCSDTLGIPRQPPAQIAGLVTLEEERDSAIDIDIDIDIDIEDSLSRALEEENLANSSFTLFSNKTPRDSTQEGDQIDVLDSNSSVGLASGDY
ncbi:MAG: hypothetical protein KBD83_00240 [Gammaproteobacteria bacterium]|nr:hypothetical protein [Gammaproteobacteria bacterium]